MSNKKILVLADLTRAYPGSLHEVIARNAIFRDSSFDLEICHTPSQLAELTNTSNIPLIEIAKESDVGQRVVDILKERLQAAPELHVNVISFNTFVLRSSEQLDAADRNRVRLLPWSQASRIERPFGEDIQQIDSKNNHWPLPTISLDDALKILEQVLNERKAHNEQSAIRKTTIRGLISTKEPKFTKSATGDVKGIISVLIAQAEAKGLVTLNRGADANNPTLWLAKPHEASTSQTKLPMATPEPFADILKGLGMGPFPNFRDDMYDAMESLVDCSDSSKPTLQQLISKSVAKIKERHAGMHTGFSWTAVSSFLTKLLSESTVTLKEDGTILPPSFENMHVQVYSFVSDWKKQLDGHLIVSILKAGRSIEFFDTPELTGTLYLTRDDTYQARLHEVVKYLKDTSKIFYESSGIALCPAI